MNINDLPTHLLRTILTHLPLPDLLRLDLVCSKWRPIQKSICEKIQNLTILVGDNDSIFLITEHLFRIRYIKDLESDLWEPDPFDLKTKKLEFDWLDLHSTQLIAKHLPNVTSFQIAMRAIGPSFHYGERSWGRKFLAFDSLGILLKAWASKLEILKIFASFTIWKHDVKDNFCPALFESLNSCTSLKHLTFEVQNSFYYEIDKKPKADLQFLGWIEEFRFNCRDYLDVALDCLERFGLKNQHLKSICLGNVYTSDVEENNFYKNDSLQDIHSKIHQLPYFSINDATDESKMFFNRFHSLQTFSISVYSLSEVYNILGLLEVLNQLIYFQLSFYLDVVNGDEWAGEDVEKIPQLKSVRILYVYAPTSKHTDLDAIKWEVIFPNLEILHFDNSSIVCDLCRGEADNGDQANVEPNGNANQNVGPEEIQDEIIQNNEPNQDDQPNEPHLNLIDEQIAQEQALQKQCLRASLQNWKSCSKLRKIYYGYLSEPNEWNMNEL